MARPLRLEFPGAIYHITARGNAGNAICLEDADRELWLRCLGEVIARFGWRCYAYCLMDNHYHLLIETPKGNLSQGMRQLNGVYTQRFNQGHGRVGHVF
jgi:REP element-mobilizing transposase RayT